MEVFNILSKDEHGNIFPEVCYGADAAWADPEKRKQHGARIKAAVQEARKRKLQEVSGYEQDMLDLL